MEWSAQIEERVGEFEKVINDIELAIKEFRSRSEEEEERAEKQRKEIWRWNEVRESQTRAETWEEIDEKREQNINAKLPKLVITKFKDTPTDWLRLG